MSALAGWGGQAGFVEQVRAAPAFLVTVTAVQDAIALDWDAVAGAQFYRVYCGMSPDALALMAEVSGATQAQIGGLTGGQQYFVQVTAVRSPRQSLGSVSLDATGNSGPTQATGVIVSSVPERVLTWDAGQVEGQVVLSSNVLLAECDASPNPDASFNNYDQTLGPVVDGLLVYAELVLYPPFGAVQFNSEITIDSVVGVYMNADANCFIQWMAEENDWLFSYNGSTDSNVISTLVPCAQSPTVFGFLVDTVKLVAYSSINGQWMDTTTQSFVDDYTQATPIAYSSGSEPVLFMSESREEV